MPLGEVLRQVKRPELVADLDQVPFAGVRWYAEGVYRRDTLPSSEVKTRVLQRLQLDDIVYNRMWATKASFGRVKEDADGCLVTNDFPIFEVDPDRSVSGFIELFFHSPSFQEAASLAATGTTERRRLHERDFVKIPVALPPMDEQLRIVDLIRGVDDTIEAAQNEGSTLVAQGKQVFPAMLTGRAPFVPLDDLLDVVIDHRGKTPTKLGGDFTVDGVPVISAIHVKNGQIAWEERYRYVSHEMYERWMSVKLCAGDVLLTSEAPLGAVAQIATTAPLVLSQRLYALRGRENQLDSTYLRYFLSSEDGQRQLLSRSSGTTVIGIRQSELRKLLVPLPPLSRQREIASVMATIDQAVSTNRSSVDALRALRVELLSALLSGAHRIPETYDELMGA